MSEHSLHSWATQGQCKLLTRIVLYLRLSQDKRAGMPTYIDRGRSRGLRSGGSTKQLFYSPSYTLPLWNKHVVLLMCNCAIPSKWPMLCILSIKALMCWLYLSQRGSCKLVLVPSVQTGRDLPTRAGWVSAVFVTNFRARQHQHCHEDLPSFQPALSAPWSWAWVICADLLRKKAIFSVYVHMCWHTT